MHAPATTPRNPTQETAISVHIVPGMRLALADEMPCVRGFGDTDEDSDDDTAGNDREEDTMIAEAGGRGMGRGDVVDGGCA
eukprot:1732291-Rhodomonas_salina.3